MNAAQYIFAHFSRCRSLGLCPNGWAFLLWLESQGEWRTRREIYEACAWLQSNNSRHIMQVINPLLALGVIEVRKSGLDTRPHYKITPAGVRLLNLPKPGKEAA